ncbi:MAG: reverse transcriptase family protein [Sedimenticola sp.]
MIVTRHKGGKKRKDDPDNYRAITLTSTILKLLERILYTRLDKETTTKISDQQGGFQKGICVNMTSFLLRETVLYATEQSSKLYTCFLDVRKAFDKVWHDGLFVKLHRFGVHPSLLKLFINMYTDMNSYVLYKGHKSETFPIRQGTRQGGVTSPFFYILYIDALLKNLEQSNNGGVIYQSSVSCPTVADDMVLISFSKTGLSNLMDMCYEYSQQWRYEFNASKCSVVVFNESENDYLTSNRQWHLGNATVEESRNYTHLGISIGVNMSLDTNIKEAVRKLKGSFLGIVNSGVHEHGLHPLTSKKIYKSVVLPRALYGCELWNNLSLTDVESIERAHRFCVKYIQGLAERTKTAVAFSLLGMSTIESEIDAIKLRFLGQLCHLSCDSRIKNIFLNRLTNYDSNPGEALGFIPDIHRVLRKYLLTHVLHSYSESGIFVSKYAWKSQVSAKIHERETNNWRSNVARDAGLNTFALIQTTRSPCKFWKVSAANRNHLPQCRVAVKLLGRLFSMRYRVVCGKCGISTNQFIVHALYECSESEPLKIQFWRKVITVCGDRLLDQFTDLDLESQLAVLFGADDLLGCNDASKEEQFWKLSVSFLHRVGSFFGIG